MSLTNIVYTPVDTGTAKISPKRENANLRDFYLLIGKETSVELVGLLCIFSPYSPSPLFPFGAGDSIVNL